MAECGPRDEVSTDTLNEMFMKGLRIHEELESSTLSTNSPEFQHKVRKGILLLEDATRLVSLLDLFSHNEEYDELPTESLKFLMLPVLLGSLNNKLVGQDRKETIEIVETYYNDFMERNGRYGVTSDLPKKQDMAKWPEHARQEHAREQKKIRYIQGKALDESLAALKEVVQNENVDDDSKKEYYRTFIRKFVLFVLDELPSLQSEKEILEGMAKMRAAQGNGEPIREPPSRPSRPFKPIIITKDALQKEVFGLGYKNIPVMSIEEFYEQRVRDGWFPKPSSAASRAPTGSLQDRAADAEAAAFAEEEEMRKLELKEENDDPEELERKRNFDRYKDNHKRGEGNRHNKG